MQSLAVLAKASTISSISSTVKGLSLIHIWKKEVSVYHRPVPGGKSAVTLYRTLARKGELSLMEAELLTGRTHQIRASFADAGHPLLGDGKYGSCLLYTSIHLDKAGHRPVNTPEGAPLPGLHHHFYRLAEALVLLLHL